MPEEQHDSSIRRIRRTLTSNAPALALGILAVIIAGTGTAVAVTLSHTTINDPIVTGRAARIDGYGRLTVAGSVAVTGPVRTIPTTATINQTANVSTPANGYATVLTQPTTATVAVTKFAVGNPSGNKAASNASYYIGLTQITADANGNCVGGAGDRTLVRYEVAPGDYRDGDFATPLLVAPVAGKKYCLAAYGYTANGAADTGAYFAYENFSAYAVSGSVTANGTARVAAKQPRKTMR